MYHQKTIAIAAMVLLAGCQSSTSVETRRAQSTNHQSQSVYEIQFDAAQRFNLAMRELRSHAVQYCNANRSLEDVKTAWQQGMESWMHLQGQERGPAEALEQNWNIQFWPDKKNTTGRKMAAATKIEHWDIAAIQAQSVTVQGLGSVEWLLYDNASTISQGNKQECSLLVAVSDSLVDRSNTVFTAWNVNPWTELDTKDWHAEYLALLSNQLDYSMKKLSRPLAKIGSPRPYFSESWRAQYSLSNLKQNIVAMQSLYLAKGNGLDAILRTRGEATLADDITHQFEDTLETWPEASSLFDMLQTKEGYRSALAQFNKLEQLKYLINEEASIKLGVVIGFNATDGD
ncbi:imelysin family protein [Vibrio sp. 10N]|uniref:imelysin family protein n=1 Tax=Vibrio sp. 10N TaxID=3058938 RepID=UPI0028134D68|nr:imelysin family protein [Vibrio sp. 10N]